MLVQKNERIFGTETYGLKNPDFGRFKAIFLCT